MLFYVQELRRGIYIMIVLAKPINKIILIKEKDAVEFLQDFNKNKVSSEFLASCAVAGELFHKQK